MEKATPQIHKTKSWEIETKASKIDPNEFRLSDYHVLFFSDLHWNSFPKRPQKLSLNLAENYKVLYVEYLHIANSSVEIKIKQILPNLLVLSITTPGTEEFYSKLTEMTENGKTSSIAYIFSVSFYKIPTHILFRRVIYDCMQDACPLKDGGIKLIKMESELLEHAFAVVASNRLLFEAKLHQHHNVHYLPTSTYSNEIFNQDPHNHVPRLIPSNKGPCIGYVGIIDERIDFSLIRRTAELSLDFSFVLIGPVTIDLILHHMPPNVYFPGKCDPENIAYYLEQFDICMVPYITSNKNKHICPSKILDYMRAKKNIVCTTMLGTIREFPMSIEFISGALDFSAKITTILKEKRVPYLKLYEYHLRKRTWKNTLSNYRQILK